MNELMNILFAPANVALSAFLGLLFLYWIFNIISGIEIDSDFDVDLDVDLDTDFEFSDLSNAEIQKEHLGKNQIKGWQKVLVYFNFVDLPFMFTFTSWIFTWWALTISLTYFTDSTHSDFGIALCFMLMLPSLLLNKWITSPFKSFFRHLQKDGDKAHKFEGKTGLLLSNIGGDKIGNVRLKINDDTLTVYGKSLDGSSINKDDEVIIINQSDDKKYYYIKQF